MFAALLSQAGSALIHAHEEKSFLSYMREMNVIFTGDEYHLRLGIFLQNQRFIQEHNAAGKSFKLGLNKLAHYTNAEYRSLLGARPTAEFLPATASNYKANDECDWRDKGVVNPIKDQAQCGSCWAFSMIQAQESQWAIKNGQLISLAEQNIVDCVTSCYGCNGGWPSKAYDYVISKQGGKFMKEDDYPYTAKDGTCKWDASKAVTAIKSYVSVKSQSEDDLAAKVSSLGPASICIDASMTSFHLYSSGIYDEPGCSSTWLDHAVGCVGYAAEYWIVRNSWGTSWGEQGYIRMIRNKSNQCGVATTSIVPQD